MLNWELFHRVNAIFIAAFIFPHLGVHLFALASPDAHAAALSWMRQFYADPRIELLIVAALALQLVSGWAEMRIITKPGWRLVRNLTGLLLSLFILLHVGSVFHARLVDQVPTDFYWVAGAFAISPLAYFALAFYGLGVFSLFAHLLAVLALAWPALPVRLNLILWLASAAITASLLLAFSGRIYPVDLPADVITYYSEYWQRVSGEHPR